MLVARIKNLWCKSWRQSPAQLSWSPKCLGMLGYLYIGLRQQMGWGKRGEAAARVLGWQRHPTYAVGSAWRASLLLWGCLGAGPDQRCVSGLPLLLQSHRDHTPEPSGALCPYPPLCGGSALGYSQMWQERKAGHMYRQWRGASDTSLRLWTLPGLHTLPGAGNGVTVWTFCFGTEVQQRWESPRQKPIALKKICLMLFLHASVNTWSGIFVSTG